MRTRAALPRTAILAGLLLIVGLDPALVATGRAERPDPGHPAAPAAPTVAAVAAQPAQPPRLGRPPGRRPVAVSVTVTRAGHSLPRSFLGLSFEYWDLPRLDRHPGLLTRVFDLLHVPGDGPTVLRLGGDSADFTYWREHAHPLASPLPSFRLGPAYFRTLRSLTERAHLRLLLDLNLAARDPGMARSLARTAVAELPRRSIESFSVGNEPDLYPTEPFYRLAAVADVRVPTHAAWDRFDAASYTSEFTAYARALAPTAPGVPMAGPEVADPGVDLSWLHSMVASDRPRLGMLTAHRYPLSACVPRSSSLYPTIGRILNPRATVGEARSVWPAVRLARAAGLPFRVTEMNSVTCGGVRGVSDTFATALWAPDALFALLRAGVAGVNVHVRASRINAAFIIEHDALVARPLLYGLLAFVRTLAGDSQLVGTRIHAARKVNLAVWAVRTAAGRLNVLALDKGSRPIRLTVAAPGIGPAAVQRLSSPGVRARTGVTLAGQTIGPLGQLLGRFRTEHADASPRGYTVTLAPYSGALIGVRQRAFPVVARVGHYREHNRSRKLPPAPARRSTPRRARPARPGRPAARSGHRTSWRAHGRGPRNRAARRHSR